MNSNIRHSYLFTLSKEACAAGDVPDGLETPWFTEELEELNSKHELDVEKLKQKLAQDNALKAVRKTDPLVDNMVEALWATAHSRRDNAALCAMLEFDYLPQSCLRQARKIKDEAVRCAYLNRSDTVNRKELLETETRSKVYASICDLAESDVDVFNAIVAKLVAKPTKILANGVLSSSISQTKALILAIDFLGKGSSFDETTGGNTICALADNITKALNRSAEDFRLLATCLITNRSTDVLESFSLDKVAIEDYSLYAPLLLDWFEFDTSNCLALTYIHAGTSRYTWSRYRPLYRVVELLTKVLDPLNGPREQDVQRVRNFMTANWVGLLACMSDSSCLQSLAKAVNCPPNYTVNKLTGLAEKAAKSKGKELRQAASKLVAYLEDDDPLVDRTPLISVLSNKELYTLPEKLRQPIISAASETDMCCALALNPTVDLLSEMIVHSDKRLSDDVWSLVTVTDADLLNIMTRVVASREDSPGYDKWSYYEGRGFEDKLDNILSAKPSKEVYRLMPWASLESIDLKSTTYLGYLGHTSDECAVREHNFTVVSELLNEALGESPAKWESFSHLASTWTGSFGELLDAARLL